MSVFNAGLPQRASTKRTLVGEIKYLAPGSSLLFNDDEGVWLRTGSFIGYSPVHAALAKNHPGWLCRDMPTGNALGGANQYNGKIFYLASNYICLGGGTSGNWLFHRYGTTLATGSSQSLTGFLSGIYFAFLMGANIIAGGAPNGAIPGMGIASGAGAFSAVSSGLPASATTFSIGASNGVNLGVIINSASVGSNAAGIYTTVNGSAYTNRTGTGGANGNIQAAYWSPCAASFLYVVQNVPTGLNDALNKTADGYTQSVCSLPSGVTFRTDSWDLYCASSATSTLILLADGRILRTTDGTNFTIVDPASSGCLQASSTSRIVYDGSKYIIYNNGGGTSAPTFIYSTDDGQNWRSSVVFEDLSSSLANSWSCIMLGVANGKPIVGAGFGANVMTKLFDMSGLIDAPPTKVGSYRPLTTSVSNSLPTYGYVRTQ